MSSYFAREEGRGKQDSIKIKEIPHLTSPERISQLNFSHNDIRSIPLHIASARNLQIIDLSHNKISKIDHICRIPSLKFINLSYNLIAEVPNDILNLIEIQNIDLAFNKITILNNIKVLKQLVEFRTFERKGFIEINLEGNEILKKKGCKEICKKWMSPSLQEYKRQPHKYNSDKCIHLTKKRNSKSLEMPLKDSSMMLTHRTHLASQKMDQTRSLQAKSKNLQDKVGSALKQSVQITEKLSPNFVNSEEQSDIKQRQVVKSQILNTVHNFQDLSKVFQSTNIQDISNLGEWFCVCIDELNDLAQKFALLVQNDDTNNLQTQVKDKIHEECSHARQIITICLELVKETIQNKLGKEEEQKHMKQIVSIDRKIKSSHNAILKEFGNSYEALPIKLYKVWVTLYRKLKSIIYQMPQKIANHRASYARQMQIQELLSISPDKKSKLILRSHEKRQITYKNQSNQKISASKEKLDELLFSKNKSECLLLSDTKNGRVSSQKKSPKRGERDQCDNCLMFKWINNKNKDEIAQLTEKVKNLETLRDEQQQLIQNLQKFKQKYLNLATKQELIIGELQYLNPSTYQNFLLQQAKTIEYMLHTSDLVDYHKIGMSSDQGMEQNLQEYSSKQMVKDKDMLLNTRLTSTNNIKNSSNHNKVSEFSIQGKQDLTKQNSNTARGSSYFKHKNIVTTVNRTNEDLKTHILQQYLSSQKNKPKEQMRRQEVVVSQFNSHVNSIQNTSSKNKNVTFEQFSTQKDQKKQQSKSKNKGKISQKSSKVQNDIILISQGSDIKNVSLSKLETLKANNKKDKNKMFDYLKSQEFNQILRLKLKDVSQKGDQLHLQRKQSLKENPNLKQALQRKTSQKHPRMNSELSDKQNKRPSNPNLTRNKTVERFYEDFPTQNPCAPMQSTQAESYKRYVKYHLRNNIMEILFKKSNLILDQNSQKFTHYTKTQKLINKKNTTQRSQLGQEPSRRSEINKTFR